jgi:nicotinate-nucleotide pyrophosphorylase
LRRTDALLDKDLERNNDTTTDAMLQRGKHASTTRVTVEKGVMQTVARQLQQLD